jgi:hypothetical protein
MLAKITTLVRFSKTLNKDTAAITDVAPMGMDTQCRDILAPIGRLQAKSIPEG